MRTCYLMSLQRRTAVNDWAAELYRVVGVRDRATFERGARVVRVDEAEGSWSVVPFGRQRGYWQSLNEDTVARLDHPTLDQLGEAVRSVLAPW
jgi:hypothetical protein